MTMEFKNALGRLVFGQNQQFKLTGTDGLGFMPKTRNVANFAGFDGQYCTGSFAGARIITLSGDFTDKDNSAEKRAVKVLSAPGNLRIGRRCAEVVCERFETEKRGGGYKSFVIQFTADYPYFEDTSECVEPIAETQRLIKTKFVFPLIMSKRRLSAEIVNSGDIECRDRIEISSARDCPAGTVTVENVTSGKSVTINYGFKKGETLTVDFGERKIYSDISGDALYALDTGSFMSDFSIEPGRNEIRILNGTESEIYAKCVYKRRYGEAVI